MAFMHMDPLAKVEHNAHGSKYEILVFHVRESGQHRIYVVKDGFGRGPITTASAEQISANPVCISSLRPG